MGLLHAWRRFAAPGGQALELSGQRRALYVYTRPAFGLAGCGLGYAAVQQPRDEDLDETQLVARERGTADLISLVPLAMSGLLGVAAVARGYGGLGWLAHPYERWAWGIAFGSLPIAAGAGAYAGESAPPPLLGLGAGFALAATAGERLGPAVGRFLLPPAALLAGYAAGSATQRGDGRPERALQACALLLLPALHICPPVYTLGAQALVSYSWLGVAAFAATMDASFPLLPPACVSNAAVAAGAASLLRVLVARRPICQY